MEKETTYTYLTTVQLPKQLPTAKEIAKKIYTEFHVCSGKGTYPERFVTAFLLQDINERNKTVFYQDSTTRTYAFQNSTQIYIFIESLLPVLKEKGGIKVTTKIYQTDKVKEKVWRLYYRPACKFFRGVEKKCGELSFYEPNHNEPLIVAESKE